MFASYIVYGPDQVTPIGSWSFDETLYCTEEEEYRTTPEVSGFASGTNDYTGDYTNTITGITGGGNRIGGYLYDRNGTCVNLADFGSLHTDHGNFTYAPPFGPQHRNASGSFATNIPIFETQAIATQYRNANDTEAKRIIKEYAINYYAGAQNTEDTQDYYIYNTYDTANIDLGIVTYTGGDPTGRFEIIKADKVVGYMVDPDNSLEFRLLGTNVVGSVYSSVNKYDVIEHQTDPASWTREAIHYTGPFYKTLTYMPDGDYTIGVTLDTNILIFGSEQDALDNINGLKPDEDAINYGSNGRPEIATNETGNKELQTEFGGNESINVFSHDYIMNRTSLATIGGRFFDTSILQALLDGLKLYGNNPMDSVLSCLYFPFDLSTICNSTPVSDIYFGSYKMENFSGVSKVSTRSGYKELGETFIKPTFYNWLDYAAMHIYLYLPYIGFVELDVNKYMNKTLKIIYMVDIHSGECEVSLCSNGLLMDTYSGQIGIKQAITYNDLANYYQSQITALRNGVMTTLGMPIGGGLTGAQMGSSGGPYGAIAGAAIGAGIGTGIAAPYAAYTGRNIFNTKPPLFSKGGYSSEIGANMPQYAFLVFMYNDVEIPENEINLYGKPSNKSGNVGSFSGFLSTSYVQLKCSGATETEKEEILNYLQTGIYI